MEILKFILISIISSSGLLAGYLLSQYVKEELKKGDKYFQYLRYTLALLIFGLIFYFTWNTYIIVIALIYLFVLYFNKKYYLINCEYALLSIILYLAMTINLSLIPGLIFIYGLPTGTRYHYHKRKWIDIATSIMVYVVISTALFFL